MAAKNQVWNWNVDSIKLKDLGGVPMEIETKGSIKLDGIKTEGSLQELQLDNTAFYFLPLELSLEWHHHRFVASPSSTAVVDLLLSI
jgi:hypothetical protein